MALLIWNGETPMDRWEIAEMPHSGGQKVFLGNDGLMRRAIEMLDEDFSVWLQSEHPPRLWDLAKATVYTYLIMVGIASFTVIYFDLGKDSIDTEILTLVRVAASLLLALVVAGVVFLIFRWRNRLITDDIRSVRSKLLFEVCLDQRLDAVSSVIVSGQLIDCAASPEYVTDDTTHVVVPVGVSNEREYDQYLD